MVEGCPPHPRNRTVVTPIPVIPVIAAAVEGAVLGQPAAVQVQVQPLLPLQLPTLGKFATMAVPPPVPNAGAALTAAPGLVGAANNAVKEKAVLAQCFVANAAMVGVGLPIIVNEADAAAMHRPRCIDNMEVSDGINRAILQSTAMIGEAISARGCCPPLAAAGNAATYVPSINSKLELLHKQHKLAIKVGDELSIVHCERMICLLEANEAREMDGGH
jgi:hypothetical protein